MSFYQLHQEAATLHTPGIRQREDRHMLSKAEVTREGSCQSYLGTEVINKHEVINKLLQRIKDLEIDNSLNKGFFSLVAQVARGSWIS